MEGLPRAGIVAHQSAECCLSAPIFRGPLRPLAWHPLLLSGALLISVRALGLFLHFTSRDPTGNVISSSPGHSLLIAMPYHGEVVVGAILLLLLGWRVVPPIRPALTVIGTTLFLVMVVIGQLDLGMQWFVGQQFSPMVFDTYVGKSLLSDDLLAPLLHQPRYVATSLLLILGPWAAVGVAVVTGRGRKRPGPSWTLILPLGVLLLLFRIPIGMAHGHQLDVARPPELLWANHWLIPNNTPIPDDEDAAVATMRRLVDPFGRSSWVSSELPLVRETVGLRNRFRSAQPDLRPDEYPDIIVLAVESLRGVELSFIGGHPGRDGRDATPFLSRLADSGVVFGRHLSSGDPSPRGYFGINAGVWDHRGRFLVSGAMATEFDALPSRLRARGYHTMGIWGADASFDNQLYWGRQWFDTVRFPEAALGLFIVQPLADDALVDVLIEEVSRQDSSATNRPVYAYVSTNGTHEPFTLRGVTGLSGAQVSVINDIDDERTRYRALLTHLDVQIERLVEFLDARDATRPYVLIVTGDHSDIIRDVVPPELRGLPHDPAVWTGALIVGPAALVGPPRVEVFPTSHVDLTPTILDLVGDRGPTVSMGTNLFADIPDAERFAVSVSGRGYRLDRWGWSLYVLRDHGAGAWTKPIAASMAELRRGLAESPFTEHDVASLRVGFDMWSLLTERNRVWRDSLIPESVPSFPRR